MNTYYNDNSSILKLILYLKKKSFIELNTLGKMYRYRYLEWYSKVFMPYHKLNLF